MTAGNQLISHLPNESETLRIGPKSLILQV